MYDEQDNLVIREEGRFISYEGGEEEGFIVIRKVMREGIGLRNSK